MRFTRVILPVAATAAVGVALFGGGAVDTAFTSTATGTLKASTASIGTKIASGTVTLANAIPGTTGPTSDVTITNQGSTPETISVSFGAGSNPNLDGVVDVIWDGQDIGTFASLAGGAVTFESGTTLAAKGDSGDSVTIPVALELDSTAGDSAANTADTISYTVTGTAAADGGNGGNGGVGGTGWNRVTNTQDITP